MEKLCQQIVTSHEHRQALRKELKSGVLQLKEETAQMLEGFRKQVERFRNDVRAAKETWQKTSAALAEKRRRTK